MKLTIGSLFSGAGLGDFGWELAGFDLRWQIENNEYCQKVLERRWPNVKRFQDIKKVETKDLEKVDIITGGFPCQPYSVAGKRRGQEDDRNLWPEMFRIIKDLKPRWVVGENVPGIVNLALDQVLSDLEAEGYESWPVIFPAHALGAPHKRDRLWIVAHARCEHGEREAQPGEHKRQAGQGNAVEYQRPVKCGEFRASSDTDRKRKSQSQRSIKEQRKRSGNSSKAIPNTTSNRLYNKKDEQVVDKKGSNKFLPIQSRNTKIMADTQGNVRSKQEVRNGWEMPTGGSPEDRWSKQWLSEPAVGRVVNGMPHRVDRLKCLGNGQVVQATYFIGELIKKLEKDEIIKHLA